MIENEESESGRGYEKDFKPLYSVESIQYLVLLSLKCKQTVGLAFVLLLFSQALWKYTPVEKFLELCVAGKVGQKHNRNI